MGADFRFWIFFMELLEILTCIDFVWKVRLSDPHGLRIGKVLPIGSV